MSEAATMENVTLSLAGSDLPVLRTLSRRMGWKMRICRQSNRERSETTAPCQYTEEEAMRRILLATADVETGTGLISHEDLKRQVRSWYK